MAAKKPKKVLKKKTKAAEDDIDRRFDDFSEEVGRLGERFGSHCEEKGKKFENWFQSTFGIIGPLISSIFGLIIIAVMLWLLTLVNIPLGSGLINNVYYFVAANIGWFLVIFLFFGYTDYASKKFPGSYRFASPIVSSLGIIVALWVFSIILKIVNLSVNVQILTTASMFIDSMLLVLFYVFILLGYLILFAKMLAEDNKMHVSKRKSEKGRNAANDMGVKRIYRSGKDKVLGGVCGGIAEYLGVDPVIIRILWVVFSLTYGTGVLAYIICWIVIPRNPSHNWD